MFKYTSTLPAYYADTWGDQTCAVEALIPQRADGNARCLTIRMPTQKLIVALVVSDFSSSTNIGGGVCRCLSPVGALTTGNSGDAETLEPLLKYLFIPIVNLIRRWSGADRGRQCLQASEFRNRCLRAGAVSGKFSGPIEAQRHLSLFDRANQGETAARAARRYPVDVQHRQRPSTPE